MTTPDYVDVIHPERLTEKAIQFEGTFSPEDLEGLDDVVASPAGELRYSV